MDDLLMAGEPKKKKKAKKKKGTDHTNSGDPKHHAVHVHVNVVNNADSGGPKAKKNTNEADDTLRTLRGW